LELRAFAFADRDPPRRADTRADRDFDLDFALFFTARPLVFFVFGFPKVGSIERREKVKTKARHVERALSLGSDTTIIELPSYP